MKKATTLILVLLLIGTIAFAQGQRGQRKEGMRGNMMGGMNKLVFGISQKDFKALGLSEEQQTKINELQKTYNDKYIMPKPGKRNSQINEEQNKYSAEEIKKLNEERKKAAEQLYKDFKSLLTEEQLKAYETAFNTQIDTTKKQMTEQYKIIGEKIALTDEQKVKVTELINNYNGIDMSITNDFITLLTDEQKTAFQAYQKEQMEQMMKNRNGNRGSQRRGKGKMPPKQREE